MQDAETPPVSYRVEVNEGALGIVISIGPKSIPVAITPAQAAALGRSLVAASALLGDADHVAEVAGVIETSDLPVSGWRTGVIRQHGLAVLIVDLLGGCKLTLQFKPGVAAACGLSLLETGRTLEAAAP